MTVSPSGKAEDCKFSIPQFKSGCRLNSLEITQHYIFSLFWITNAGTELFSQRAPPEVSSPRQIFTTEFGMVRCVSLAPGAPACSKYIVCISCGQKFPLASFYKARGYMYNRMTILLYYTRNITL